MKKTEKIERLLTINYYGISEEKLREIASNWTHKGRDTSLNMWHKYYTTKAHECISYTLIKFSEKQLNINAIENCLNQIEESK